MARSPEDAVSETRDELKTHSETLNSLAKKAVDKAFNDATNAGSLGSVRVDTRSLTEIGD